MGKKRRGEMRDERGIPSYGVEKRASHNRCRDNDDLEHGKSSS